MVTVTSEQLLELMKQDPFLKSFQLRVIKAEKGEMVLECDLHDHLKRLGNIMNGGAIMSLIDAAGGLCLLTSEEVQNQVTSSLTINFLRPVSKGPVRASGRVVKGGKNLGYTEIEVTDGDGKSCARAIGTWFLFR